MLYLPITFATVHAVGSSKSEEDTCTRVLLKRLRAPSRITDGERGGLLGLNAKDMSSSFTATTPECMKREHIPLNCTLVPGDGTGVVHHFGFSAEYMHLKIYKYSKLSQKMTFLHNTKSFDVVQYVH